MIVFDTEGVPFRGAFGQGGDDFLVEDAGRFERLPPGVVLGKVRKGAFQGRIFGNDVEPSVLPELAQLEPKERNDTGLGDRDGDGKPRIGGIMSGIFLDIRSEVEQRLDIHQVAGYFQGLPVGIGCVETFRIVLNSGHTRNITVEDNFDEIVFHADSVDLILKVLTIRPIKTEDRIQTGVLCADKAFLSLVLADMLAYGGVKAVKTRNGFMRCGNRIHDLRNLGADNLLRKRGDTGIGIGVGYLTGLLVDERYFTTRLVGIKGFPGVNAPESLFVVVVASDLEIVFFHNFTFLSWKN